MKSGIVVVTMVAFAACAGGPGIADPPVGEGEGEGEDEQEELAVWSADIPNPSVFPGPDDADGVLDPVALDFALRYTIALPEPNTPPATLTIEVCMKRASEAAPACSNALEPSPVRFEVTAP